MFNTVRTFYKWLGGGNPFEKVKAPARLNGWTPKAPRNVDVDAFVGVIDDPRDRLVVALLLNGLRATEVTDLRTDSVWNDEDYTGQTFLTVIGKGNKQRTVAATTETLKALESHQPGKEWLVESREGGKMTLRQVEYVVQKWQKRAGLEGLHPHAFRHHYATRLVRANANLRAVQAMMGHESLNTTQQYLSVDLGDLVAANRLDPRSNI